MKKQFLFFLFFNIPLLYISQNSSELPSQTPVNLDSQKITKTLVINISDYPLHKIGELKDELIVWKEKVISIHVNEDSKKFILVHNHQMLQGELFEVLKKYGIQKNSIISYK